MAAIAPVPVFNHLTNPFAAGNGQITQVRWSTIDSGTTFDPLVWLFPNSGSRDGIDVFFQVPINYVGSAELKIAWAANLGSALDVIFDWEVLGVGAGEDLGAAAARTSETVTDTSTGTAFELEIATITLTDGDYAAGEWVHGRILRSSDLAGDDSNVDIVVFWAGFYSADA